MFFKKKKIKLECYTPYGYVANHFPLQLAKKDTPEAFDAMPAYIKAPANYTACPYTKLINTRKLHTIKHCDGILGLWEKSYILYAPFDIAINIKNNKVEYTSADTNLFKVAEHPTAQFDWMFPNYVNIKMVIPWKFIANKSLNCMFSPAFYHLDENIRENVYFPQAIVDYKYVHSTNILFFVKKQVEQKVIHIKAGTPLIYITPLTDEPIELVTKVVDKQYWEGLENQNIGFKSIYKALKRKDKNK